jgi:hypothetical protein
MNDRVKAIHRLYELFGIDLNSPRLPVFERLKDIKAVRILFEQYHKQVSSRLVESRWEETRLTTDRFSRLNKQAIMLFAFAQVAIDGFTHSADMFEQFKAMSALVEAARLKAIDVMRLGIEIEGDVNGSVALLARLESLAIETIPCEHYERYSALINALALLKPLWAGSFEFSTTACQDERFGAAAIFFEQARLIDYTLDSAEHSLKSFMTAQNSAMLDFAHKTLIDSREMALTALGFVIERKPWWTNIVTLRRDIEQLLGPDGWSV